MHWAWFGLGLLIIIIGAIVLTNVAIPYVTSGLDTAFGYIPVSTIYSSIGAIVIGFLIMIFGGFRQKLGKYFKYY